MKERDELIATVRAHATAVEGSIKAYKALTLPHRQHALKTDLRARIAGRLARAFVEGLPIPAPKPAPLLSFGYFYRSWWRKFLDSMRAW